MDQETCFKSALDHMVHKYRILDLSPGRVAIRPIVALSELIPWFPSLFV